MEFGLQLGQAFRGRRKILRGHQAGKIPGPKKTPLMHEELEELFLELLWPAVRFKGVQRIEVADIDK